MGIVYRARHRLMDRVVAVKTLPTGKIKPDAIQRFYREVKAAARLSHPNIVTAYDAGEHAGTHYLVMEYVVGRDLAVIVKEKGPLPLPQAIDHARQAARGLEYAHKHGVVHRDVKPSNLLLDQEGVVKILDMGLALLSEELVGGPEAMDITGTGQILGTVDYMSPEQAEDVHSANHLSDIYSLGCTLFYLLTRRSVFSGENVVKRILAHRDKPIPTVTEFRPDCPEALDQLVRRMLAKRPEDRPQGMGEIIADLENCLVNPAAVAPPVAAAEPRSAPIGQSWLEDLVSEQPTPATDNFKSRKRRRSRRRQRRALCAAEKRRRRVLPAAFQDRPTENWPLQDRPVQDYARWRRKKAEPVAPDSNRWKIIAAATAAAPPGRGGDDRLDCSAAGRQIDGPNRASERSVETGGAPAPRRTQARFRPPGRVGRRLVRDQSAGRSLPRPALVRQCDRRIHGAGQALRRGRLTRALQRGDFSDRDRGRCGLPGCGKSCPAHLDRKEYARGRAALQTALTTYGHIPGSDKASRLIHEIDEAQRQEHAEKPVEVRSPPCRRPRHESPAVSPEFASSASLTPNLPRPCGRSRAACWPGISRLRCKPWAGSGLHRRS